MNRIGMWSASMLFLLGTIYACTVIVGMTYFGFSNPIVGTILIVMEMLTLIYAPLMVILMCSIYTVASENSKPFILIALAFMIIVVGLTVSVHFIGLTVHHQTGIQGLIWPSTLYAVELLAWDLFLGLALIFSAPAFRGQKLKIKIRVTLIVTGILCITGIIGPVTGDMRLQFIAVFGYGILLPMVWLMIAKYFYHRLFA